MIKYGGKLIFEGCDEHETIEVIDRAKIRTLHFGTPTEQSSMYLEKPFALEMEYIRNMALGMLFKPDAKEVLCLGMGGGALPKFIWKYYPACHVKGVELSQMVIDVGHRYFQVPRDPRFTIYCEEALTFLRRNEQHTEDLLFVDLYISKGIAPAVAEIDFFPCCDKVLRPGGILVWNMWRSTAPDVLEQSLRNLAAVFGRNLLILSNQESSNYVVLAFKEPIVPYDQPLMEVEAKRLKVISQIDFPRVLKELNHFKGHGYLFQ